MLYSLLTTLALGITAPWWLWHLLRTQKYREGIAERLGRTPARIIPSARGAIWLHAVSVGEVLAATRLVEELERARPGVPVYVSTTTRTGQALARERFGAQRVFYYPLDFAFATRAWLRLLGPSLIVLVESEFWPRLLIEAQTRGIAVAVVNARISDRSWPRYRRLARLWKPLLGTLALALAQSEEDAGRLVALGAKGARCVGNLKFDIRTAAENAFTAALRAHLVPGVPVVVCGSTLAGEEALLLHALPLSRIFTVLAPRHPERFDEVARLLVSTGIPHQRRTLWRPGGPGADLQPGNVLLLDSIGELASLYSLAALATLGGGFLHQGGHNPLEPAQFGVPVLMGARYDNFRAIVDTLLRADAVILSDAAALEATVTGLLAEPARMQAIGDRARQVFLQQSGATSRTVEALLTLLDAQTQGAGMGSTQSRAPAKVLR